MDDNYFMNEAIKEAKKSLLEGGIPIGALLVKNNEIIGRGHNKLIQNNSSILHAEMDAIENAGRLKGKDYEKITFYTTLSPCPMCSGAIILYNIPKIVIGENKTLMGGEQLLKNNNVKVTVLKNRKCRELLEKYIENNPYTWEEELERVNGNTKIK